MFTKPMTTPKALLVALGLFASGVAFANSSEPTYQYLPPDVLKANIETSLNTHQIDTTQLDIQVDDKGIVNASGDVASKEQAENITKIIRDTQSVYAVFGKFVYPQP